MSPGKEAELCGKYAELYRTCRRFEHGDGWYEIVDRLSSKLTSLIEAMPEGSRLGFHAMQVKDKFGALRFYMSSSTHEMDAAIKRAMAESEQTCEQCGDPGSPRFGGWVRTLCDLCARS